MAIAIALLNKPDLIVADEPTTALDVTIQGQILYEVQKLCSQTGTALIWITHDLSVVAGLADQICVMYAGKIVESGEVNAVLDNPMHPYTHGLITSVPSKNKRGAPLSQFLEWHLHYSVYQRGARLRPDVSGRILIVRSSQILDLLRRIGDSYVIIQLNTITIISVRKPRE